jgi:predicted DNA-binding antitoxin AbrB/MazE fold protein
MSNQPITVDAVFEGGVLRPLGPLPLSPGQQVTLTVDVPDEERPWPPDVADVYREIAEEDRRIAESMWGGVQKTWPKEEGNP